MNTDLAFVMGEVHKNDPLMVFDWNKAARILSEKAPDKAVAGLKDDFEYTGGPIWINGKPYMRGYTYLASTWAKPLLVIDGEDYECWAYSCDVPDWNADTKWPESALAIVRNKKTDRYAREILKEADVQGIDVPTLIASLVNEYARERGEKNVAERKTMG